MVNCVYAIPRDRAVRGEKSWLMVAEVTGLNPAS